MPEIIDEEMKQMEDEELPDTPVTKFMKYFPPAIFLMLIFGVLIIWVIEGPDRVMELITMVVGDEPSPPNITQALALVALANVFCLPSSFIEILIAYQLGWWAIVPNIFGDLIGCFLTYLIGRQFFAIPPGSASLTIQAVQKTIVDKPYQFALLLRVAPIPSGLKNYGSGAVGIPLIPYIICTSILAPMFSLSFTLVGVSARGVVDEVAGDSGKNNNDIPLWLKLVLLICVSVLTVGLTTYVLKSVHGELQNIMEEAKAKEENQYEIYDEEEAGDIIIKNNTVNGGVTPPEDNEMKTNLKSTVIPIKYDNTPNQRLLDGHLNRSCSDTPITQRSLSGGSPKFAQQFANKHPFASAFFSPQTRRHPHQQQPASVNRTNVINPLRLLDDAGNGIQVVMESLWMPGSKRPKHHAQTASFHMMSRSQHQDFSANSDSNNQQTVEYISSGLKVPHIGDRKKYTGNSDLVLLTNSDDEGEDVKGFKSEQKKFAEISREKNINQL